MTSPYTEGWPCPANLCDKPIEVVPLSDAERMREERDEWEVAAKETALQGASNAAELGVLKEALEAILTHSGWGTSTTEKMRSIARRALNPEQGA